jgi:hypothetical protein
VSLATYRTRQYLTASFRNLMRIFLRNLRRGILRILGSSLSEVRVGRLGLARGPSSRSTDSSSTRVWAVHLHLDQVTWAVHLQRAKVIWEDRPARRGPGISIPRCRCMRHRCSRRTPTGAGRRICTACLLRITRTSRLYLPCSNTFRPTAEPPPILK